MRRFLSILALLCSTSGCIHAQGNISVPVSGTGRIGPGTGAVAPPCTINAIALPAGTVGTAYPTTQLTAANCVAPLVWSVSVGTLPTGLSLSSGGLISGTPSGAGTSAFTITLVDNAAHHPTFPLSVSITSTTVAGAPLAPDTALTAWDTSVAGTPTSNITDCVGTPMNASILPGGGCASTQPGTTAGLQAALNAVACGHVINVAALSGGVTIQYGAISLPSNKKCANNAWIWLTGDLSDPGMPAEHVRPDPCYAGIPQTAMPYIPYAGINGAPSTCTRHYPLIITAATSNTPPIRLSIPTSGTNTPSIGHWRIQKLQCGRDQSTDAMTVGCISLDYQPGQNVTPINAAMDCGYTGSGSSAIPSHADLCAADQPDHLVIKQMLGLEDPQRQTVRAIAMGGGTFISVEDNHLQDIQDTFAGGQGDAQAIAGGFGKAYTGPGNWIFQNNFTASSSEGQIFCGAFSEPISPVTNKDGVPTSIIWNHIWSYKPIVWDTQRGQALSETLVNEGITYPTISDQEVIFNPLAFQISQGGTMSLNNTWLNDSAGGWNRFNDSNGTGTVTVDGVTYLTPNSANGIVTKTNVAVGVAPYRMENIIQYAYVACSGAGVPIAACTGVTTAVTHTLVFDKLVIDGRAASLGNDRHIINTITVTVTATAPSNQIALTPSSPDLQIQPSYSDSFGNIRNFAYVFTASLNFASTTLTYKVDGIVNGNASVGRLCLVTAIPCTAPGANDKSVAYVSGTATGTHTISVTSAAGTTTSQTINVSLTSPIWGYDLKAMTVKNLWEAKCINRGLLENSLLENTWGSQGNGGGQNTALLLQPANNGNQTTDGSGAVVGYGPMNDSDFSANNVHILHTGGGLIVAGLSVAKGIHRVSFSNILMEDFNGIRYGHGFKKPLFDVFVQFAGATGTTYGPFNTPGILPWTSPLTPLANDVNFSHITSVGGTPTVFGINSWLSIANQNLDTSVTPNTGEYQLGPFSIKDSIFESPGVKPFYNNNGEAGDCGTNQVGKSEAVAFQGAGYTPPTPCFSTYSLARNALVDSTASGLFSTATIWQPKSTDSDLFVNYNAGNGGDYHVKAGGQYDAGGSKDASDGLALGADIDAIAASDAIVRWGAPNPPTVDLLTWAAMPSPDRLSKHMHGSASGGSDTYSILDTDAGYPAGYPSGLLFWVKHSTGNPWDIETYDANSAARHWITEDGDSADQAACVSAGFPAGCWGDPNAYKRFLTPVQMLPRNFTYGTRVTIDTPGPNTFARTTNCEITSTFINLGDIQSVTTGPYLMTWGGTIDSGAGVGSSGPVFDPVNGVPTIRNDYYYGGTLSSGVFNDKESTFYVSGSGRVGWFFYQLVSGTYVLQQYTVNNVKTSGAVEPSFPCGAGKPWWP